MHPLVKKLEQYIKAYSLFKREDKLLLALSGGPDSTALAHMLKDLNFNFKAAHCNFELRDDESEKDESFVRELSKMMNSDLFVKKFETSKFAEKNKYSIEEAARILRYTWFEDLRVKQNIDYILTAHHLNDKIETFFINLTAGTGIRGLRSIQSKNAYLIRPLLFASQIEIMSYCSEKKISYRTDKSNSDTKFIRNKIRHKVIPVLKEINPNILDTMSSNFDILNDLESIYDDFIHQNKKKLVKMLDNHVFINIKELLESVSPLSLLYEIISPYGFNSSQTKDILASLPGLQSGKLFLSKEFKLLKDRKELIISKIIDPIQDSFIINEDMISLKNPVKLNFSQYKKSRDMKLSTDNNTALIDAEKIKYPLMIRSRRKGDYFYPFGMKGKKLISDFFTDIKLNQIEKEKTFFLISEEKIVWVIGHRIDDRFKITNNTKKILKIEREVH